MRFLLVGGAGYVGAHVGLHLLRAGHAIALWDDLSTGHRDALPAPFHEGDLHEVGRLSALLQQGFDGVFHFAALSSVGESVRHPLRYWRRNVEGTRALLEAMGRAGNPSLVFSSSAAVYGDPGPTACREDAPLRPTNPYGQTKAAAEAMIRDVPRLRAYSLRYFNAVGADPRGAAGESHREETHLIPLALEAARLGRALPVFGGDFPTRDGSALRDYVHVDDLARAHLLAMEALLAGDPGGALNLGTAEGATVLEVAEAVRAVTGTPLVLEVGPRRAGDPAALVADAALAGARLGWKARWTLTDAVKHAWTWSQHPTHLARMAR